MLYIERYLSLRGFSINVVACIYWSTSATVVKLCCVPDASGLGPLAPVESSHVVSGSFVIALLHQVDEGFVPLHADLALVVDHVDADVLRIFAGKIAVDILGVPLRIADVEVKQVLAHFFLCATASEHVVVVAAG